MKHNNEHPQNTSLSKFDNLMILLSVVTLIILLILVTGWSNGDFLSDEAFESQIWKNADNGWLNLQPSLRKTMVKDLIENNRLASMSMSQVSSLLGKGRILKIIDQKRMTYFLGPLSFNLGADDRLYLCVEFKLNQVSYVHTYEGI